MADISFLNPITVFTDIGGVAIDILTKRTENYENIITQNPIEDGSPSTDHITNLPPKISLSGGFSDIQIDTLTGTILNPLKAVKGLAKTQFDKLLEMYVSKETFELMDGLHLFKDMQFKSLKEVKDREGFSVFFEAEIWNIIKVELDANNGTINTDIDALDRFSVQWQSFVNAGGITSTDALESIGILA